MPRAESLDLFRGGTNRAKQGARQDDEALGTLKHRLRGAEEVGESVPPGGSMKRLTEKRWHSRIRTHFEISYSSGREDGSGILTNISYSGALLTDTSVQPRLGSQVRVYVLLNEESPFEVVGQVVRYVEDGFAIEYSNLSPEVRRLVDDAAAMVKNPPHVPAGRHPSS